MTGMTLDPITHVREVSGDPQHAFTVSAAGSRVEFEYGGWADGLDDVRVMFGDWPLILDPYVDRVEADPAS